MIACHIGDEITSNITDTSNVFEDQPSTINPYNSSSQFGFIYVSTGALGEYSTPQKYRALFCCDPTFML